MWSACVCPVVLIQHGRWAKRRVGIMALVHIVAIHVTLCAVLALREKQAQWSPVKRAMLPGSHGGIPCIIHQMHGIPKLPAKWHSAPVAWTTLHPPAEYTYMLWTDESLRALIESDYPWLLQTYDSYPYATQRWDASRLAVLHKCAATAVEKMSCTA